MKRTPRRAAAPKRRRGFSLTASRARFAVKAPAITCVSCTPTRPTDATVAPDGTSEEADGRRGGDETADDSGLAAVRDQLKETIACVPSPRIAAGAAFFPAPKYRLPLCSYLTMFTKGTPAAAGTVKFGQALARKGFAPRVDASTTQIATIRPNVQPTLFQGSSQILEFVLPKSLGRIASATICYDLRVDASAALIPSPCFTQLVQLTHDGNVLEQLYDADVLHDCAVFNSTDGFALVAEALNVAPTGGFAATTGISTSKRFYVPLQWASGILSSGIAPKHVKGEIRIKATMAPYIRRDDTSTNVSLNQVYLLVETVRQSPAEEAALAAAYQAGYVLRAPIRSHFSVEYASLPAGSQTSATLTAFASDVAALIVYLQPTSSANSNAVTRYDLETIGLRDAQGADVWSPVNAEYIQNVQAPQLVTANPVAATSAMSTYPLIFSSNLDSVLAEGAFAGGFRMSGQERIVIQPNTTRTNVRLVVTGILYGVLQFKDGNLTQRLGVF
jgi:hypothetical protein